METRAAKDLLRKIQDLELAHVSLKEEISKLLLAETLASENAAKRRHRHESYSASWKRISPKFQNSSSPVKLDSRGGDFQLKSEVYLNILQSMGQAIHIMNTDDRIIYWNRPAQNLYGYSAAEALGKTVFELLVDFEHLDLGIKIVNRVKIGECWTGLFPVRSKMGRRFSIIVTDTPLYDEDGKVIGVICIATDSKPYEDMRFTLPDAKTNISTKFDLDPEGPEQQPLQDAIASKITDLATKVGNKVQSKLKGNASASFFGTISKTGGLASKLIKDLGEESEGRASLHKITSKAEAWISKKSIHWPWKGNQQEFSEVRSHQSGDLSCPLTQVEIKANEFSHCAVAEENVTSSSSLVSVSTITTRISAKKLDMGSDCLDYEIFWEDLTFKEQIGQGSCGTVYHGLWCGSDVAIKVFPQVEYSEDAILSFRQEVSLMKELRHPNTLLFMGAVLSPQCLSIITELLPRGSLFRLLKKDIHKLDWRRRIHMALDIAQGMNYLHHCNPPIVHRDLKSLNLLVDKNWTVKVADFGLSRIKHETYLTTKTGKGTPQWMAPEVLRNDPSDEKSDVYSFGVILWELATEKIPWEDLNAMQIIGAVGFKNQRLDIPSDVDSRWAAIIESCWQSEPRDRPAFEELLKTLKHLAREYAVRSRAAKSGTAQKER